MLEASTFSILFAGRLVVTFPFDEAGKKQPSFQRAPLINTTNKDR